MLTLKDNQVIQQCVGELISELNYKHFAKIDGKNNSRKLESHGYIELKGTLKKNGDIQIIAHFRDFNDGSQELDKMMIRVNQFRRNIE